MTCSYLLHGYDVIGQSKAKFSSSMQSENENDFIHM